MKPPIERDEAADLGELRDAVSGIRQLQPPAGAAEAAQQRLMSRLRTRSHRKPAPPRLSWALGVAAAALVAMVALPLLPGNGNSLAFADVQRRFETFDTLAVDMSIDVMGGNALEMSILLENGGAARIDTADAFTFIVDPRAGRMLQLFHDSRTAMQIDVGQGTPADTAESLAWLQEIRQFQGQARRLPEMQTINGRLARGFVLEQPGQEILLWASPEGEPLAMSIRSGDPAAALSETRLIFDFDVNIAPERLSLEVPPGYRLLSEPVRP